VIEGVDLLSASGGGEKRGKKNKKKKKKKKKKTKKKGKASREGRLLCLRGRGEEPFSTAEGGKGFVIRAREACFWFWAGKKKRGPPSPLGGERAHLDPARKKKKKKRGPPRVDREIKVRAHLGGGKGEWANIKKKATVKKRESSTPP